MILTLFDKSYLFDQKMKKIKYLTILICVLISGKLNLIKKKIYIHKC